MTDQQATILNSAYDTIDILARADEPEEGFRANLNHRANLDLTLIAYEVWDGEARHSE